MTMKRTKQELTDGRTARIRDLNDRLRRTHVGGRIMITAGVQALGAVTAADVLRAVAEFSAFTPDNDPYGEHDCAVLVHTDQHFIWKIDYYDKSSECGVA